MVGGFLYAALCLFPVLGQRRSGVGKMVFRIGGDHHQDAVRAYPFLPELNRRINSGFADRHSSHDELIVFDPRPLAALLERITPEGCKNLLRVSELGNACRVSEVGNLNLPCTSQYHLLGIKDLGVSRYEFFFVLETIAHRYVSDGYLLWHFWKDFPIIIFRHRTVMTSSILLFIKFNASSGERASFPLEYGLAFLRKGRQRFQSILRRDGNLISLGLKRERHSEARLGAIVDGELRLGNADGAVLGDLLCQFKRCFHELIGLHNPADKTDL